MSARSRRVKLLLIAECEVRGRDLLASALAQLDSFREAVQPAAEYGITLYRATAEDVAAIGPTLWRVEDERESSAHPTAQTLRRASISGRTTERHHEKPETSVG